MTGTRCWAAGSVSVLASSLGVEMAAGFIFSSLAQGASWMGTGLGRDWGQPPRAGSVQEQRVTAGLSKRTGPMRRPPRPPAAGCRVCCGCRWEQGPSRPGPQGMWPLALPSAGPERDGLLTQCHAGCRDESQPRPGPVVTPPRLSWELAEGCRVTLHDVTCGRTSQTLRLLAPLCSGPWSEANGWGDEPPPRRAGD